MSATPSRSGSWIIWPLLLALIACGNGTPAEGEQPSETHGTYSNLKIWNVSSPDGEVIFTISSKDDGGLKYRVDMKDTTHVIGWSDLGITVSRGNSFNGIAPVIADFSKTVTVASAEAGEFSQSYTMLTGKRRKNQNSANSLTLNIQDQETKQRMNLEIRVQNEGFGFRYSLPDSDPLFSVLDTEHTTFAIGEQGRFWGQPYDFPTHWKPAYETAFENGLPSGTATGEKGTGWGFPSLFHTSNDVWLLLHEAGLSSSFHGSHLKPSAPEGVYFIAPPLEASAWGYGKATSTSTRPWIMPWRIGIVARNPGDILESNLVFDFAEPSRVYDTSWINPGVASWSWLSDHESSRNLDAMKDFIDLSAEMNWPYSLIDANWNTISETSMEDLTSYANAKDVGLFFWYNSGGRHNTVPEEPRNIMDNPELRRNEFAKLKRLGVKGVKVDFFQSDKQDMIALYLDILKDAADNNILVNFHGSTIPRGWARTWPNLMTMEAVRGGEVYTFPSEPDYGALAPWHNTILPFTRNVIGSMDYTPVIYSDQLIPRRTTHGHETALALIFESGVQHIGDSAKSLRLLPFEYKEFLRTLPTVWDETRYLSGEPGDHVVLARRNGDRWYVAGINGAASSKSLTLDLSFLASTSANAIILHDDESGRKFQSSPFHADDMANVAFEMQKYGGFVLILSP